MDIVLASESKYKANLLKRLGFSFTQQASYIDEVSIKKENISNKKIAERLSQDKAQSLFVEYPNSLIIAGDQVCGLGNEILDKPMTRDNAVIQLQKMQGLTHQLHTGVCLLYQSKIFIHVETIQLSMRKLTLEQIENYINLDSPLDCAGSYKLECHGIALFESIQGDDHSSIEGLPLMAISNCLENWGLDIFK